MSGPDGRTPGHAYVIALRANPGFFTWQSELREQQRQVSRICTSATSPLLKSVIQSQACGPAQDQCGEGTTKGCECKRRRLWPSLPSTQQQSASPRSRIQCIALEPRPTAPHVQGSVLSTRANKHGERGPGKVTRESHFIQLRGFGGEIN